MKKIDFDDEISFSNHLEELRWRLIYIAVAVFVSFFICYSVKDTIISILVRPLPVKYSKLTFLAPAEALIVVLKVSFFSGILLSLPLIFYQLWCFICPALLKKEKILVAPVVIFSTIFFLLGISFAYFIILPFGLSFLLKFGESFGVPNITLANYLSFITKLLISFGAVFELPIVIAVLTKLGLIDSRLLIKNRGAFIVMIFVISAFLTPPDVATQIMMSIPLWILFEFSIFVSKFFEQK